jgi:protease-4
VHVSAKPGGFTRAIMLVLGLFLFAAVFVIGLTLGVISMVVQAPMGSVLIEQPYRNGTSQRVAVIPVTGIIDGRQSEFVRAAVDRVLSERSIRAVVLRVNSPGGGVTASDQIWYQVERLKKAGKPVVASFGGLAASGGYYVSCGADQIFAEETTVTGSIGVIAQVLTMEGLMDKVGIEPVTLVASGSPEKDVANDVFRSWNDEDREKIKVMLDAAYGTFLQRVQEGRGEHVEAQGSLALADLANGSIYTAANAVETGLVDTLGYLDDAIIDAERRAGLTPGRSKVVVLREPPTLFGGALPALRGPGSDAAERLDAESIRSFVNELASPRIMYLMR